MEAIRGVPWTYVDWGNFPEAGPSSPLDDEVAFSLDTTTQHLKDKRDAVVIDVLHYMFYATNWTKAVAPEQVEDFVKRGYDYNTWGTPTSLRV